MPLIKFESKLKPPMTLIEAMGKESWRPGVHYHTQVDEIIELLRLTVRVQAQEISALKAGGSHRDTSWANEYLAGIEKAIFGEAEHPQKPDEAAL